MYGPHPCTSAKIARIEHERFLAEIFTAYHPTRVPSPTRRRIPVRSVLRHRVGACFVAIGRRLQGQPPLVLTPPSPAGR